jgi:hypothetical protein
MQDGNEERLKLLCEEAATEHDAPRLIELVKEINDLLEAKRLRLRQSAGNESPDTSAV